MTAAATIAERVGELVRIPSVNPLQAGPKSGDEGERALSAHVADRLDDLGADVTVDEVLDGRANVYARFEGTSDRAVTVDVHMDTVGVEHMTRDPFDGAIEDGRVYGRGSVDTKATLAVVMHVLEEMRRDGQRPVPTINVVGTVSEEIGGLLGAERYAAWLRERGQVVDQLIVAEPTSCAPVHGHKGGVGLDIVINGHAAHSSKPHLGQNAVIAAARVILALDEEHQRLQGQEPATPVGVGTLSTTMIEGGLARNIIPDCCHVYAGRRIAPEENVGEVYEQLSGIVRDAAAPLSVDVSTPYGEGFSAFYQEPDSPLIMGFADLSGEQPETADYGSNALEYHDIAHEVMVFGPGSIDQAHQAVEWVDISELDRAADIYRRFFTR